MPTLYPAPNPAAVFWRREKNEGQFDYATIQSMTKDDYGNWKALFLIPGQAPYYINQNNNDLRNWEPIYALTDDSLDLVIEKIAQRVTAILTEQGKDSTDIVPASMGVVLKDTVEEAIEAAVEATVEVDPEQLEAEVTDSSNPDYFVDSSFNKSKKQFTCGVCDKLYAYEKSLLTHIKKEHSLLPGKILENAQ